MKTRVYRARGFLLSCAELHFLRALRRVVRPPVAIAPKVRLADVVGCRHKRPSVFALAPITQKHLDFVLYDWHSSRILAAVELDDSSHDRPKTARRDALVNKTLSIAGVRLFRIPAAHQYDVDELARRMQSLSLRRQ